MTALLLALSLALGAPPRVAQVPVGPGVWRPIFPPEEGVEEIAVPAFKMDVLAVTNGQFLAFVLENPEWRRDRLSRTFADEGYLKSWSAPDQLGPGMRANQPVTQVSWFAARAYCTWRGARLPTVAEWELAAAASETEADASQDPAFRERILGWYAQPGSAPLADVGQGPANYWGARDLHGLIWEWTEDFNSMLVSGDNREQKGADKAQFCGAGALEARDRGDYAAFMRVANRSSLEAHYTTSTLGFRCVSDGGGR